MNDSTGGSAGRPRAASYRHPPLAPSPGTGRLEAQQGAGSSAPSRPPRHLPSCWRHLQNGHAFGLVLGYGAEQQQSARREGFEDARENAETASTATIDGHTVHVFKGAQYIRAFTFPGKLAVIGAWKREDASSGDAEAAQEYVLEKLRALDLKRLAALTRLQVGAAQGNDALASRRPGEKAPESVAA